jgi:hypothetical protein
MFDGTGAGVAGLLARAQTLIGEAVAAISSQLSGPAAVEALSAAVEVESQATLAVTLLTERVDRSGEFASDGSVSMAAWLREQAHSSHGYASGRVLAGRALADDLPATLAAWKSGKLTFEHVMVIRKAVDRLDPADVAQLDRALAAAAASCSPKDLRAIAQTLLEEFVPDRQERRRDDKEQRQRLHLSDTLDGGRLDADLDAESTAILKAAIAKYLPPPQAGVKASYRRAVALIEMARQALDFGTDHPGASNKPHLVVTISDAQLRSELGVGSLPDGTTLPASTVRRMACDAKIIPAVLGSNGLPLDIGRTTRTIPPQIRTALNLRDKGCRYPGCDRPPSHCDAHHVDEWGKGGKTALEDLVLQCRTHHIDYHKGRFKITRDGQGGFIFTLTPHVRRT